MSEQDVDDVAFLTGTNHTHTSYTSQTLCPSASYTNNLACELGGVAGTESPAGPTKKSLYENNGVAACSQKRALFIATVVFALLFLTSVIIAYTGPQSGNFNFTDFITIFTACSELMQKRERYKGWMHLAEPL